MIERKRFFEIISSLRVIVPAALLFLGIEAVFSLWLLKGFSEASGGGILDMAAAYKPDRAASFLAMLDGEALSWYNRIQIFDTFFPPAYGICLSGILFRIYSRKYTEFSSFSWIVIMPLFGACCDWIENLGIRLMILIGSSSVRVLGIITSIASTLKFGALALSILFIFTGFGYFIKGRKDAFKK